MDLEVPRSSRGGGTIFPEKIQRLFVSEKQAAGAVRAWPSALSGFSPESFCVVALSARFRNLVVVIILFHGLRRGFAEQTGIASVKRTIVVKTVPARHPGDLPSFLFIACF